MFVSVQRYNRVRIAMLSAQRDFMDLQRKWNELVGIINSKGGRDFLESESKPQFDKQELRELLILCHPDKHRGSNKSEIMSKKINQLRGIE